MKIEVSWRFLDANIRELLKFNPPTRLLSTDAASNDDD